MHEEHFHPACISECVRRAAPRGLNIFIQRIELLCVHFIQRFLFCAAPNNSSMCCSVLRPLSALFVLKRNVDCAGHDGIEKADK